MIDIYNLIQEVRFNNSLINATPYVINIELKVVPNEITTLRIELNQSLGITVGMSVDCSFGYTWQQTSPYPNAPTISQGASGTAVNWLQLYLKHHGFFKGAVDGSFGPNTRTQVIAFQTAYNLTADGVVGSSTWEQLFRNSGFSLHYPGRFYVDAISRTDETFVADCICFNFNNITNSPYTFTDSTYTNAMTVCANYLGYKPIVTSGSTFVIGTNQNVATTGFVHTGATSIINNYFKAGELYGFYNFLFDNKLYSWEFTEFWSEVNSPSIADTDIIGLERSDNSIDLTKQVNSVKWANPSAGVFTPSNISYVNYGNTVDLRSEGNYYNNTSASKRLNGHVLLQNRNSKVARLKTYGRCGKQWLPGRLIYIGNQDGSSSPWVIRDSVWSFSGTSGFTLDLVVTAARLV